MPRVRREFSANCSQGLNETATSQEKTPAQETGRGSENPLELFASRRAQRAAAFFFPLPAIMNSGIPSPFSYISANLNPLRLFQALRW